MSDTPVIAPPGAPSLLDRLGFTRDGKADAPAEEYDPDGEYRPYSVSRDQWSVPMINFISQQGDHEAFDYNHLYRAAFDPSGLITLVFTEHEVTIRGQLLRELHQRLLLRRITFICAADSTTTRLDRERPLVTDITIRLRAARSEPSNQDSA